jgi:15-cis-phytoene desaturase
MGNGKVAVLGGGIAGLTAAHELMLRNFEVTVYEKAPRHDTAGNLGGKAKTQFSAPPSLDPLPGEHGFRFFPSFYRHVVETMTRIPVSVDDASKSLGPFDLASGGSVAQRLIRSPQGGVGRKGERLTIVDRSKIDSLSDITTLLKVWTDGYGLPPWDLVHLIMRLAAYYFSCNARRDEQWQRLTLWEFFHANELSQRTQAFLNDMPKALAAMDAKEGNTRSILNVGFLWSQDFVKDRQADRILSGPTTKSWIEPWALYLESRGVTFHGGTKVTGFTREDKRIVSAQTDAGIDIVADYFIGAFPLDVVHATCNPVPRDASGPLDDLLKVPAQASLRNMVGVQFFLDAPRPLVKGLINCMGSEWGVTSVCEAQYWDPSVYQLPAGCAEVFSAIATKLPVDAHNNIELTREQLKTRFLELLNEYKGADGEPLVDESTIVHVHLDAELEDAPNGQSLINRTPHLIHPPRFQFVRVDADVGLENLFMAGDHVRGFTDVATMEGANEGGRRAVNALLARRGLGDPCELFDQLALDEPQWLKDVKELDEYPGPQDALLREMQPNDAARNPFAHAITEEADGTPQFDFEKARHIEQRLVQALQHSRAVRSS